jgi:hypothetical protein
MLGLNFINPLAMPPNLKFQTQLDVNQSIQFTVHSWLLLLLLRPFSFRLREHSRTCPEAFCARYATAKNCVRNTYY